VVAVQVHLALAAVALAAFSIHHQLYRPEITQLKSGRVVLVQHPDQVLEELMESIQHSPEEQQP
jgi:hypothetical protein